MLPAYEALFTLLTTKGRRRSLRQEELENLANVCPLSKVFHKTGIGFKVRCALYAHSQVKLKWRRKATKRVMSPSGLY